MKNQQITSVFEEVQTRYEISNIAEVLGIRLRQVLRTLRSDSIDGSGEGKNAFTILVVPAELVYRSRLARKI